MKFGPVDILINNAGIVQGKQITDMNEKMARLSLVVNCESHIWLIREFIHDMEEKNEGQIVCVASMAGLAGNAYMTDYCASKFGAVGLNESLRIEMKYKRKNITVTTVCPYIINTGMFDGASASLIFPFLDQEYVIWRMTMAILQKEEETCIPWSQGILAHLTKGVFPSSITDHLIWLLMGWDAMSGFRG
jgi:all-trans-retinol dehydrogenase (NAD+)